MQLQMTRRAVKPEEGLAPPPAKLAKVLDLSNQQVNRLTTLIEDLLDVSRIGAGKLTYHFEPTNISDLLKEVLERLSEDIKTKIAKR